MLASAHASTRTEWRENWPVVLAALIGFSTLGLQSYGIGAFVPHLEQEFGWTRAQVMIGISVSNGLGILLNIIIGMIVDRFGSRRVGILGLFVKTGAFALLGTATGTMLNWSLLWVLVAIGVVLVQSTVWTRVIAARFDRTRGLALAVMLCGSSFAAIVLPVLSTWLIAHYGWRNAFVGVGAIWLAVSLPPVFLLFRDTSAAIGAPVDRPAAADLPGLTFSEGIRTPAFLRLAVSFGCFSFFSMTIATNLIPLLLEHRIGEMEAGRIASIMGVCGLSARLTVGFLLDRYPGRIIGAVTLMLPVFGAAIFLMNQPGALALSVGVGLFGAAIGAEIDVALYLATRHFGLKAFGGLFSAIITAGAVNASIGPFIAGTLHDRTGSYDSTLLILMVVMTVGAASMLTIKQPEHPWAAVAH